MASTSTDFRFPGLLKDCSDALCTLVFCLFTQFQWLQPERRKISNTDFAKLTPYVPYVLLRHTYPKDMPNPKDDADVPRIAALALQEVFEEIEGSGADARQSRVKEVKRVCKELQQLWNAKNKDEENAETESQCRTPPNTDSADRKLMSHIDDTSNKFADLDAEEKKEKSEAASSPQAVSSPQQNHRPRASKSESSAVSSAREPTQASQQLIATAPPNLGNVTSALDGACEESANSSENINGSETTNSLRDKFKSDPVKSTEVLAVCKDHFEDQASESVNGVLYAGLATLLDSLDRQRLTAMLYLENRMPVGELDADGLNRLWKESGLGILILKAAYASLAISGDGLVIGNTLKEIRLKACQHCLLGQLVTLIHQKFVAALRRRRFSVEKVVFFEEILFAKSHPKTVSSPDFDKLRKRRLSLIPHENLIAEWREDFSELSGILPRLIRDMATCLSKAAAQSGIPDEHRERIGKLCADLGVFHHLAKK